MTGDTVGTRHCGRTDGQIRSLAIERGVISRADGSARWAQDGTSVVAAVHGPRATAPKNEDPTRAVVDVVFRPMSGIPGAREADLERAAQGALESVLLSALHPRTEVQVVLQVLSDDGSVLPCALNAACLALVDAGVPLRRMVAAVGVALVAGEEGGYRRVLDPDRSEEAAAAATICVATPSATLRSADDAEPMGLDLEGSAPGFLQVELRGRAPAEECMAALDLGRRGCRKLLQFQHGSLGKGLKLQVQGAGAAR